MRSLIIALTLGGLTLAATPAQSREVRRLSPTSKWVVNYAEDTCKLVREFGAGDQKVTLLLEQFVPGQWFKMSLVGDSIVPVSNIRPIEASLRFGPHEQEIEVAGIPATIGTTRAFLVGSMLRLAAPTEADKRAIKAAEKRRDYLFELPPIGRAREQAATSLEITRLLRFNLVLDTGAMAKPLEALRECSWDTVKSWGLPVDQQKSLSRKVVPTTGPQRWFSSSDYPGKMVRGGFEGIVNFRVIVDEAGRPVSCHIQSSTQPKEFDDAVCKQLMARGKFHPALDASVWVLPLGVMRLLRSHKGTPPRSRRGGRPRNRLP